MATLLVASLAAALRLAASCSGPSGVGLLSRLAAVLSVRVEAALTAPWFGEVEVVVVVVVVAVGVVGVVRMWGWMSEECV